MGKIDRIFKKIDPAARLVRALSHGDLQIATCESPILMGH